MSLLDGVSVEINVEAHSLTHIHRVELLLSLLLLCYVPKNRLVYHNRELDRHTYTQRQNEGDPK